MQRHHRVPVWQVPDARPKCTLKILATPSEQQVGVYVVATRDQRYRRPGLERLFDQLSFEFARKAGALARCLALAIHNLGHFGSRQNI